MPEDKYRSVACELTESTEKRPLGVGESLAIAHGTMTKSLVPIALAAATLTAAPAFAQHRGDRGRESHGVVVVRPYGGVYARRPVYAPRYYYARPYYAFRPHFSLGFGINVGYPVAYPVYAPYYYGYGYPAPYGYPSPYSQNYPAPYPSQGYPYNPQQNYPQQSYPSQEYPSQGYPSQGYPSQGYPQQNGYPSSPQSYPYGNNSMQVQPQPRDVSNAGGVSFEISPSDAEVFVDGNFAGTVDQFGPQSEPLRLSPGRHRIEIRAGGMQPMSFDAQITAGQVIPYRGTLQR